MTSNDTTWDKLLKIKTTGRDATNSDCYNYPYEPTPYCVLERLANSGLITSEDTVLDYGCGKGRVEFFLAYQTKAKCIGIEYDERIYTKAMENHTTGVASGRIVFELRDALKYRVPEDVTCIYFFNPFSIEILRKVMTRIIESYYQNPRDIQLLFYYPSDEYISYLMTVDELEFVDEIDCGDMFEGDDDRERIMIFHILSP